MPILHPATFWFLQSIKEHNTRTYFSLVKPVYQEINDSVVEFCDKLIWRLKENDPSLWSVTAKQCMFRIYRDARRLKEWDLIYKQNFWFAIWPNGKKDTTAWYYTHLQSWESFFWGGIYRPEPYQLKNLRNFLALHWDRYYQIINSSKFKKMFGEVQWEVWMKIPQWFAKDVDFPELVKRKQFLVFKKYTDEEVLADSFFNQILHDCETAKPLFDLLNEGCEYDGWKD